MECSAKALVISAKRQWLKEKGIPFDSRISNWRGRYYWEQYLDFGSHYSGYYEVEGKYKEGDEEILLMFDSLINSL